MKKTWFALLILSALAAPMIASGAATHDVNQVDQSEHQAHGPGASPPGLVEKVRDATQPFRDLQAALDAHYEEFLGCVSGAQEGAMGIHFVNFGLVQDPELHVDQPEALIYEPRNGQMRLVGVEYIVDVAAWHANPLNDKPPVLEGQVFQYNGSPNRYGLDPFYELHVWSSRENPNGAFADWNPRVSCEGR